MQDEIKRPRVSCQVRFFLFFYVDFSLLIFSFRVTLNQIHKAAKAGGVVARQGNPTTQRKRTASLLSGSVPYRGVDYTPSGA